MHKYSQESIHPVLYHHSAIIGLNNHLWHSTGSLLCQLEAEGVQLGYKGQILLVDVFLPRFGDGGEPVHNWEAVAGVLGGQLQAVVVQLGSEGQIFLKVTQ